MKNIKPALKKIAKRNLLIKGNVNSAYRILKAQERIGNTLSSEQKNQCDKYARNVLGSRYFSPWLQAYTLIQGEFKEGWLPSNLYKTVAIPALSGDYAKIANLRTLEEFLFPKDSFPYILSYCNGVFYKFPSKVLNGHQVKEELFSNNDKVLFKLDESNSGKGIYIYDKDSFDIEEIKKINSNGVFQYFIDQHSFFNKFSSDSVSTLRVTTVSDKNGQVSPVGAYIRFGMGSDEYIKANNSMRVPLDMEDGSFEEYGYDYNYIPYPEHPDSKAEFAGQKIPHYQKCLDEVISLHKAIPFIRCIGWDIAIDDQGNPKIMEWNAKGNDIDFHEATQGPCFKGLFEELQTQDVLPLKWPMG